VDQEVDGDPGEQPDRHPPEADPLHLGVLRLGGAGDPQDLRLQGLVLAGQGVDGLAGGRAQDGRLHVAQRRRHRAGAEHLDGRGHRPLGPDRGVGGAQQLGGVLVQHVVAGRQLGEAEVDQPGTAVGVEEHVGQAQVPVGDPLTPQLGDLLPDPAEHVVGDRVGLDRVERAAVDGVVGQHHGQLADRGHGDQVGRAHAGVGGLQRHQRLVLDGAPQGRVRQLVADVLQPQPPPGPEQEVRVALVVAQGLDEQPPAVGELGEVRGRAAGVHAGAFDRLHLEPGTGERVRQLLPARAQAGPAGQQQPDRPDRDAQGDRGQHVQRHLVAGHHADDGEDPDQPPGGPPYPMGQPGAGHGGGGGRPADPAAAGEAGPADPGLLGQGPLQQLRMDTVEPRREHALQDGGGHGDGDQQQGQAEPAQHERHGDHHQRGHQRHHLHQPDEEGRQRRRHPVGQLEQVGLDPHHGVLGPDGQGEAEQERGHGHDQAQHVDRRPLIGRRRRLGVGHGRSFPVRELSCGL